MEQTQATAVPTLTERYITLLHASLFVLGFSLIFVIGLLLVINRMTTIAIWAQQNGFYLDLPFGGTAPIYIIATLAGLLSFLPPCVLPLVPAYIGYLSGQAFGDVQAK